MNGPTPEIDRDWFGVTLQGGTTYRFSGNADVSSSDTLDALAMRLYWNNTTVASSLVEGPAPEFTFVAPGTGPVNLYVAVSAGGDGNWQDKTGAYQLSLEAVGAATPVNHRPVADAQDASALPGTSLSLSSLFSYLRSRWRQRHCALCE